MGIAKINPESVACFSHPESDRQSTTFDQHSTTNSPSKNHALPPVFAKTASKNTEITPQKKFTKLWMIGFPEISK
jgi:hypothetical protein